MSAETLRRLAAAGFLTFAATFGIAACDNTGSGEGEEMEEEGDMEGEEEMEGEEDMEGEDEMEEEE